MAVPEQEPLLDIARGDAARSRYLRAALGALRDSSGDEAFRSVVNDVLAGKASLRDAAKSEVFSRGLADRVDAGVQQYANMSEREREVLAAQGEHQLAKLREQIRHERAGSTSGPGDDDEDEGGGSILRPVR